MSSLFPLPFSSKNVTRIEILGSVSTSRLCQHSIRHRTSFGKRSVVPSYSRTISVNKGTAIGNA